MAGERGQWNGLCTDKEFPERMELWWQSRLVAVTVTNSVYLSIVLCLSNIWTANHKQGWGISSPSGWRKGSWGPWTIKNSWNMEEEQSLPSVMDQIGSSPGSNGQVWTDGHTENPRKIRESRSVDVGQGFCREDGARQGQRRIEEGLWGRSKMP